MTIQDLEEKLLQHIDDSIDTATDDELFAGGYLRGHISLAAAECEASGINDIEIADFKNRLSSYIVSSKHELNPYDYLLVENILEVTMLKLSS
ncbi:TPA: YfcL family protein [Photobacterium damselae]